MFGDAYERLEAAARSAPNPLVPLADRFGHKGYFGGIAVVVIAALYLPQPLDLLSLVVLAGGFLYVDLTAEDLHDVADAHHRFDEPPNPDVEQRTVTGTVTQVLAEEETHRFALGEDLHRAAGGAGVVTVQERSPSWRQRARLWRVKWLSFTVAMPHGELWDQFYATVIVEDTSGIEEGDIVTLETKTAIVTREVSNTYTARPEA